MTPEFSRNHFELFGLPVAYSVDPAALERAYRDLQGRVHPDRFASASEAERRVAMQWATRANEAYRTLRNPIDRARYLLSLKGFDTRLQAASKAAMKGVRASLLKSGWSTMLTPAVAAARAQTSAPSPSARFTSRWCRTRTSASSCRAST